MSQEHESHITTDREMIRSWGGQHDAMPVRDPDAGTEPGRFRIVPEADRESTDEQLTWDAFFDELDRSDYVVVYHGDQADRTPFEVVDQSEALGRAAVDAENAEQALLAGETVTSEITETVVIEETIVEEATIESEVISRKIIEEEIVDAELLTREVEECRIIDPPSGEEGMIDIAQFDVGYVTPGEFEVEITADEGWSVTKEILERLTIESRVIAAGASETDTIVTDSIDFEGVQQSLLESDLIDSDMTPGETMASHPIESSIGENDVIQTQVLERKTVDEEISLSKRLVGEIGESETLTSESIRREVLESALVDEDIESTTDAMDAQSGGVATSEAEPSTGEVTETESISGESTAEVRTTPTEDDEGKAVVGAGGEELGMVYEVKDDTLYVDPHPTLTDRIKAALDWGEMDDDAYPVMADQIRRIDNDRVELQVETPDESTR